MESRKEKTEKIREAMHNHTDAMVDYADRVMKTKGDKLDTCQLVNLKLSLLEVSAVANGIREENIK